MASIPVHNPPIQFLWDPSDGTELISPPDAARLMSVGRRTVYYWISKGLVDTRVSPSGKIYIEVTSLWRSPADTPATVSGVTA